MVYLHESTLTFEETFIFIWAMSRETLCSHLDCIESWPRGYETSVLSKAQNKAQRLAACGHASASSQSMRFILSLRLKSSFITSGPDLCLLLHFAYQSCCVSALWMPLKVSPRIHLMLFLLQSSGIECKITFHNIYPWISSVISHVVSRIRCGT